MKISTHSVAALMLISITAFSLASVPSSNSAESLTHQDSGASVKDAAETEVEELPDVIRKAIFAQLNMIAPHKDFEHYEWQNPEIVKFAKVIPKEQVRSLIRELLPLKRDPKEVYCVSCQADEVCTKTHVEFRTCDVARLDDRVIPLGYSEEITAGKKGRSSFNWIIARVQSAETYIVNFTPEQDDATDIKNGKWAAVCPYEKISTVDHSKKKTAEKEDCKKWLKAHPDYLKKKLAQEATLTKMLAQPGKSFKGYDDIIQKLGKPKTVKTTKTANKHDPSAEDTIRTLSYPGLVAEVYQARKFKKDLIVRLIMTKRSPELKLPVTLGASRDFVISRLGEPSQDKGDTVIYSDDGRDLDIQFKDSKVSRIEWYYDLN